MHRRGIMFRDADARADGSMRSRIAVPTNLKLLPLQCDEVLTPASVLATEVDALRGAGLSGRKVEYVLDLAAHYQDGRLSDERIAGWDPDTLERELCRVKGIGVWSVHMVNE